MKVLTREFNRTEKILLVVLGLVIIGSLYYLLVFRPISDGLSSSRANAEGLETQLAALDARVAQIQKMQRSVDGYEDNGHIVSIMPSYSAGKQELDFLHSTLATSEDYYVGFTKLTRQGNQIRREFALKFTVPQFTDAEDIFDTLEHSDLRCLISDFDIRPVEQKETIANGEIEASCVATFYETMYGGVVDAELPEDTNPNQEEVIGTYEYEPGSLSGLH